MPVIPGSSALRQGLSQWGRRVRVAQAGRQALECRCWGSGFPATRGEKASEGFEQRRWVLLTSALAVELRIFSQAEVGGSYRNKSGRKVEVAWTRMVVGDVVTSCQVLLLC